MASLLVQAECMFSGSAWCGGTDFEVVMDLIWSTFNNWGLRAAFNDAAVYTIVPYYAWGKPVLAGSANNPLWGIDAIFKSQAICVNALWQTSRIDARGVGPANRSRTAWGDGSLVQKLVARAQGIASQQKKRKTSVRLCHKVSMLALTDMAVVRNIVFRDLTLYSIGERLEFVKLSRSVGEAWPVERAAQMTLVCLQRMAFSAYLHNLYNEFGFTLSQQYAVAGTAVELLQTKIDRGKLLANPCATIVADKKLAALAVARIGTGYGGCNEGDEKEWDKFLLGNVGPARHRAMRELWSRLVNWMYA